MLESYKSCLVWEKPRYCLERKSWKCDDYPNYSLSMFPFLHWNGLYNKETGICLGWQGGFLQFRRDFSQMLSIYISKRSPPLITTFDCSVSYARFTGVKKEIIIHNFLSLSFILAAIEHARVKGLGWKLRPAGISQVISSGETLTTRGFVENAYIIRCKLFAKHWLISDT